MTTKVYDIKKLRGHGPRNLEKLFPQVQTVQDSTQRVEITVTADDAANAVPNKPEQCALAKACVRELQIDGAIIGLATSYLIKGTRALRFKTPELVAREIVSFDRHKDFSPGIYRLATVPPLSRLGVSHRRNRTGTGSERPHKHVHFHHTARVRTV